MDSRGISSSQGTISLWYKPNYTTRSTIGLTHEILNLGPKTYTVGRIRIFNNREHQDIRVNHDPPPDLLSYTRLSSGIWYHLAYTWDSAAGSRVYYLNSVANVTASGTWTPLAVPGRIYVGKSEDSSSIADGAIDDLRIYDRSLSSLEIQSLFQGAAGLLDTLPPARPKGLRIR
ncbi:MAG: LamG domain-containing protein [Elusimicrobia bacterium]|nr:LamG domain-containing protein [Elusimicrobiota bacterium]